MVLSMLAVFAPIEVEGAALQADRFAVDEDEFRVGFSPVSRPVRIAIFRPTGDTV